MIDLGICELDPGFGIKLKDGYKQLDKTDINNTAGLESRRIIIESLNNIHRATILLGSEFDRHALIELKHLITEALGRFKTETTLDEFSNNAHDLNTVSIITRYNMGEPIEILISNYFEKTTR